MEWNGPFFEKISYVEGIAMLDAGRSKRDEGERRGCDEFDRSEEVFGVCCFSCL